VGDNVGVHVPSEGIRNRGIWGGDELIVLTELNRPIRRIVILNLVQNDSE
jgi:hypothetical protein